MGPLKGIRIVEMANIGPGPFCGMLLADMGAEVLRVDRLAKGDLGFDVPARFDLLNRGKATVAVDLKAPQGVETVKQLVASADVLIEGFRPGVMERLGLGPSVCHAVNPGLIYGRMTGWGQDGALNQRAGHDINFISMMGILNAVGQKDGPPVVPLNLTGDFAGGALYLAMGILAALIEARTSGQGQVIDAAMVDGAAGLMAMHLGYRQAGLWENARGSNTVDGGSPYYTTYRTRDGKYMAVGCVEQRFYAEMIDRLGLAGESLPDRDDPACWPALRDRLAAVFEGRTRDQWTAIFEGSDACVTPVLDMDECLDHPLAVERGIFDRQHGVVQPAPAPRFSRTPGAIRHGALAAGHDTARTLKAWGLPDGTVSALARDGVIPAG